MLRSFGTEVPESVINLFNAFGCLFLSRVSCNHGLSLKPEPVVTLFWVGVTDVGTEGKSLRDRGGTGAFQGCLHRDSTAFPVEIALPVLFLGKGGGKTSQ